jgi:hypothetical protein
MGSRSTYEQSLGVVHSPGEPLVWCPKYRATCAELGRPVQAQEVLSGQLHLPLRLWILRSRSPFRLSAEDALAATIETSGRYITEQIIWPTGGRP